MISLYFLTIEQRTTQFVVEIINFVNNNGSDPLSRKIFRFIGWSLVVVCNVCVCFKEVVVAIINLETVSDPLSRKRFRFIGWLLRAVSVSQNNASRG